VNVAAANRDAARIEATGNIRRILFLVDTPGTLEQQELMARAVERAGGWEAWFMPMDGAALRSRLASHRVHEMTDRLPAVGIVDVATGGLQVGRKSPSWLASIVHSRTMTVARELRLSLYLASAWRCQRNAARRRLAALRPSCVVTAQERGDHSLPIVAAAQDLGIPVILVPSAGLFMPDGGAFMRRTNGEMKLDRDPQQANAIDWAQLLLNRLVGWLQPGHVFTSRWGRMLHRPAHWYLAAWWAGLSLPSGWYQGTRFADAIVISGEDERRVCHAASIPDARIAAIGSPALQMQHERRQQRSIVRCEIEERYSLPRERPLIILAMPVLWEHRMIDRASQFSFVQAALAVLVREHRSVLISLHPKMNRADYEPYAKASGAKIADTPLSEILTAADAFIAGGYSSTLRWALATGIPSVNLDLWDLNESTYDGFADYPTLRSIEALDDWVGTTLGPMKTAPGSPSETSQLHLICDGRFGERFVGLVERVSTAGRA
jgi:hypothetical protein